MPPSAFIKLMLPLAQACEREHGIPTSVTIAQAAVETGWGERIKSNNLFGIKADKAWHGPTNSFDTHEHLDGHDVALVDAFRAYDSWAASVADRAAFLKNNQRYAACFKQTTAEDWARAIAAGGWATGPAYADLMIKIIQGRSLKQYDLKA